VDIVWITRRLSERVSEVDYRGAVVWDREGGSGHIGREGRGWLSVDLPESVGRLAKAKLEVVEAVEHSVVGGSRGMCMFALFGRCGGGDRMSFDSLAQLVAV